VGEKQGESLEREDYKKTKGKTEELTCRLWGKNQMADEGGELLR